MKEIERTEIGWIVTFTGLFVLAIGVASGESNHVVYLLPGLHAANPELLRTDWFVTSADHPHVAFNWLVAALARTGLFEMGLALATIVQSAGLALAIWVLARRLYDGALLPWAMTLMALAATHTRGVGLSWLVVPQVEAASLAGVACVAGLALLATERHPAFVGFAFGLAALFHANYAVLLVPIAGLASVVIYRRRGIGPALMLLLMMAAVGAPSYLGVTEYLLAPASEAAGHVRMRRFPHHLAPWTWSPLQSLLLAGVLLAGLVALFVRRPRRRPALCAAVGTMVAMVCGGLLVGYAGLSDTVNQLFPWRLSSIVIMLAVLAVSAATFYPPALDERMRRATGIVLVLGFLTAGAATVLLEGGARRVAVVLTVSLVLALRSGWLRRAGGATDLSIDASYSRRPFGRDALSFVLLLVGFAPSVWEGVVRSHLDVRPDVGTREGLYDWVRTNTSADSRFAVPPGWSDFRLAARRAVVVDHQGLPTEPAKVLEWTERMKALTGQTPGSQADELDAAFLAADCSRIEAIEARYEVDFVIRETGSSACGHVAYSGGAFMVVDPTGPDLPAPSVDDSAGGATRAP